MTSRTESYTSDPDEEVFGRILDELDRGHDPADVERRSCAEFPNLAGRIRQFIARHRVLELATEPEPEETPVPDRLGDFKVIREIGRGGMGMIYEAVQEPFHRRVALKTIRGDYAHHSSDSEERFLREQAVLAKLHHTHIVPIFAAGKEGPLRYYAMEYVQGAALNHLVRTARAIESSTPRSELPSLAEMAGSTSRASVLDAAALSPGLVTATAPKREPAAATDRLSPCVILSAKYQRSVAKVVRDAADAIQHAHDAGVFHSDLKPSNIMVDGAEHCWVLDFGLAGYHPRHEPVDGSAELTPGPAAPTSGVKGTPLYMAPEQWEGRADARTDVWGLGVTLYELMTLRRAFDDPRRIPTDDPPRPRHLVRNLPPDLDAICWKALRNDPAHRYQTARELADDLRRWLRFEPTCARPARPFRRLALWTRRNRGWAAAIGLALIGLMTVMAVAVAGERAQRREAHLQQIQRIRLTSHTAGWFADVWELARQAPRIGRDDNLQSQAAAALAGLDARNYKSFPLATSFTALAFDPAPGPGRLLMSGQDGRVRTWEAAADRTRTSDPSGEGPFAFRPDGAALQLVRADDRRSVELRDVSASRVLRTFASPVEGQSVIEGWALAPDGSHTVALIRTIDGAGLVGEDGTVVVWEAGSGRLLQRFPARRPTCVALSAGGALVAAGSEDGEIFVWDVAGGEPIGPLTVGHTKVHALAFSPDPHRRLAPRPRTLPGAGALLASCDAGGEVIVWDLHDRTPRSYCRGSEDDVYAVAFSPDGTTLASCGRYEVKLWDLATGRLLLNLKGGNYLVALAFAPDSKWLAVGRRSGFSHPGGVDVWEIQEGRGIQTLRGLQGHVAMVVFSPDGERVAALAQNWQVGIWDRNTGRLVRLLDVPPGSFTGNAGLALSSDGRRFVFSAGHEARLWDVETGAERGSWTLPEGLGDRPVFRGPDQLLLCRFETKDGRGAPFFEYDPQEYPRVCMIRNLLGPNPSRPLAVLTEFNLYVSASAVSPDGTYYAVEGLSGTPGKKVRSIHVFEVATGKRIWSIPSQQSPDDLGAGADFDPTGTVLSLNLSRDAPSTLLDVTLRKVLDTLDSRSAALSPGAARWLASNGATSDHPAGLGLYERGSHKPLITFILDQTGGGQPRFSPDGRYAAWVQSDGAVNVADLVKVQGRLAELGLGW